MPGTRESNMERERKAASILGIIVSTLLMCWMPLFLWYLISSLCDSDVCYSPLWAVTLVFWVGYSSSALNQITYACFNEGLGVAFKNTLQCCCAFTSELICGPKMDRHNAAPLNGSNDQAIVQRFVNVSEHEIVNLQREDVI